jgi:hypothetical protein
VKTLIALLSLSPTGSCSVCGRRVSSSALSSCPECGAVPRWRGGHRRIPGAALGLGLVVLAALTLAVAWRPHASVRSHAPVHPAAYARAEQLHEEKRGPTPQVAVSRQEHSPRPGTLGGVIGVCLLASLTVGCLALVAERSGGRPRLLVRFAYAGAGACFGVAISMGIVFGVQSRHLSPRSLAPTDGELVGTPQPEPRAPQANVPVAAAEPRPVAPPPRETTPAASLAEVEVARAPARALTPPPRIETPAPPAPAAVVDVAPSTGVASSEPEVSASPADRTPAPPPAVVETRGIEPPGAESRAAGPQPTDTAQADPATLPEPEIPALERPTASASAPDRDLIDKIRGDWRTVKSRARSDVDDIVRTFRHWLRRD